MSRIWKIALWLPIFLVLLTPSFNLAAQEGTPFITHFNTPHELSNQNWGFVEGNNGEVYILNQKGFFSFDGLQWENLNFRGRPIAIAYSNQLFFCSDKGVGYLHKINNETYEQRFLLKNSDDNYFYKFSNIPDGLLVVSPQVICKIKTDSTVIAVDTLFQDYRPDIFISDFFEFNHELYHVKNSGLIYHNKPDGGFEMLAGLPIGEDINFSVIHDDAVFFGTSANRLFKFDGNNFAHFPLDDQNYITASLLNGGISLSDSVLALSSHNGGVILVNANDGSTINILNYFSGLPDDEVFSLGLDTDGGLWISHGMGISRADTNLPIKSYNHFSGLKGSIFFSKEFDEKLFVGTSEGLFHLTEVRDYKAVDVWVKPKQKPQTDVQPTEKQQEEEQDVKKKKRNFLSRLFSRRSTRTDKKEDLEEKYKVDTKDQSKNQPVRKRIYELQSVNHEYKPIANVQGKVTSLLNFDSNLYAATNLGLFEVHGKSAKNITGRMNIQFVEKAVNINNALLIGTDEGAYLANRKGENWTLTKIVSTRNQSVISIVDIQDDLIVLTTEFDVYLVKQQSKNRFDNTIIQIAGSDFGTPVARKVNNNLYVFTQSKIYLFNTANELFIEDTTLNIDNGHSVWQNQQGYTWLRESNNWTCLQDDNHVPPKNTELISLFSNPNSITVSQAGSIYIVNNYNHIYKIDTSQLGPKMQDISLFLKVIRGEEGIALDPSMVVLDWAKNALTIRISAPFYLKEGSVQFQYMIEGLGNSWTRWFSDPTIELPYIPSGKYTIHIRARDILRNISKTIKVPLVINPPFWETIWFYIISGLVLIILFVLITKLRERKLKREKEILEEKVKERTKTIEKQKGALQKQRDELAVYNKEIEAQRDEIELQRDQIFKQNEEITQSIIYARRIQAAVMPSEEVLKRLLPHHFILFRPRDIVSGDFYWMTKNGNKTVVIAADCTGHGIPGAIMSMMGVSFLNDIVNVTGITRPDVVLNELRTKIKFTLSQTGKDGETRDGMDMSICVFEKDSMVVHFAGAYNPLYIVREGDLMEYKGDKMPVGSHIKEGPFTLHEISLLSGDNLYMFSDGYVDQFGGDNGKKFMTKPFKKLLTSISKKPMEQQLTILEDSLDQWQGAHNQVDDILVVGIAIG
ncbi:MAG: SpoIIE family protein phosphatase [Bacteroidales bacterium]